MRFQSLQEYLPLPVKMDRTRSKWPSLLDGNRFRGGQASAVVELLVQEAIKPVAVELDQDLIAVSAGHSVVQAGVSEAVVDQCGTGHDSAS